MVRREELQFIWNRWPRPDERHLATKHIEKLGQLVQAGLAQPPAHPGDRVAPLELVQIVRSREGVRADDLLDVFAMRRLIGSLVHRAELQQGELVHVDAESRLAEEDGARRVPANEGPNRQHDRSQDREQQS